MCKEKKKKIAILIPNNKSCSSQQIISIATEYLAERNYELLVGFSNHNIKREFDYLDFFVRETDGILLFSTAVHYDTISSHIPENFPVVFLYQKPEGAPQTTIGESSYTAIFQVLLAQMNIPDSKLGCILANPVYQITQESANAYESAIADSEELLFENENMIYLPHISRKSVIEAVDQLAASGCNYIYTGSPRITKSVLNYLLTYNSSEHHKIYVCGIVHADDDDVLLQSIDCIQLETKQLTQLALQQIMYQLEHSGDYHNYLIKSTVRMRSDIFFYALGSLE